MARPPVFVRDPQPIHPDYPLPALKQSPCYVKPDKAGGARYQNRHQQQPFS